MNPKNTKIIEREPLTTGKIAEYCHVTVRAVLKWVDEGKLKAYRTPGKHSRVSVQDFLDFLTKYRMPVPKELQSTLPGKKILIVDDDREMVASIRRILKLRNYSEFCVAYDGFSAGQKFSEFNPDLIILDIKMPGLDGFEVCAYIRGNLANARVKILAMSGLDDPDVKEKILQLGADDYLAKPFDDASLNQKVDQLLGVQATPNSGTIKS